VISRNEGENRKLRELKKKKDTLLRLKKLPGPYALIKGGGSLLHARRAGAIAASYSKSRKEKKVMIEFIDDSKKRSPVEVAPLTREKTDKMLIK
jgi:predicted ribosome quality control (RQC) complex YloA/Tae2 family protein